MLPVVQVINSVLFNFQRLIVQAGGSSALEALLQKEADDALPEFLKPRPKYFYYYKWMRQRVLQHCGELPGPVMDKLLTLDATELDMLLTYPSGIKQQVRSPGCKGKLHFISYTLTWPTLSQRASGHDCFREASVISTAQLG